VRLRAREHCGAPIDNLSSKTRPLSTHRLTGAIGLFVLFGHDRWCTQQDHPDSPDARVRRHARHPGPERHRADSRCPSTSPRFAKTAPYATVGD
jgi:hypothetical protein